MNRLSFLIIGRVMLSCGCGEDINSAVSSDCKSSDFIAYYTDVRTEAPTLIALKQFIMDLNIRNIYLRK